MPPPPRRVARAVAQNQPQTLPETVVGPCGCTLGFVSSPIYRRARRRCPRHSAGRGFFVRTKAGGTQQDFADLVRSMTPQVCAMRASNLDFGVVVCEKDTVLCIPILTVLPTTISYVCPFCRSHADEFGHWRTSSAAPVPGPLPVMGEIVGGGGCMPDPESARGVHFVGSPPRLDVRALRQGYLVIVRSTCVCVESHNIALFVVHDTAISQDGVAYRATLEGVERLEPAPPPRAVPDPRAAAEWEEPLVSAAQMSEVARVAALPVPPPAGTTDHGGTWGINTGGELRLSY